MALLSLGATSIIKSNSGDDFVIAAIVDSQSGYNEPYLVKTYSELNRFGDFQYKSMFENLLNNANLLLIKPFSDRDSDNYATIRFNDFSLTPYTHPKLNFQYPDWRCYWSDYILSNQIYNGSWTFNYVFNFEPTTVIKYGDYITITDPLPGIGNDPTTTLIWFRSDPDQDPPIPSTYVNDVYEIDINTINTLAAQIIAIKAIFQDDLGFTITELNPNGLNFRVEFNKPFESNYFYQIEGLTLTIDKENNEYYLNSYSEGDKAVLIWSKIAGVKGNEIRIDVTRLTGSIHQFVFTLDDRVETFIASTLPEFDAQGNFLYLPDVLEQSELVSGLVYKDGFFIPNGTYYLDGAVVEVHDEGSYLNALDELRTSDFLFDLFVTEDFYSEEFVRQIIQMISFTEKDSMAFVRVSEAQLTPQWVQQFAPDNRLIYFYENLQYYYEEWPMYYPYVYNFVNAAYLRIVRSNIFTQPFVWTLPQNQSRQDTVNSVLDARKINYLQYDNLKYFYVKINCDDNAMNPILRFIISKINRTYRNNLQNFISVTHNDVIGLCNNINTYLKNLMPLVQALNVIDVSQTGSKLFINIQTFVPKFSQAFIKINLILNYREI